MVEFGTDLSITYVMGGLAREFDEPSRMIVPWLDASERSGMPLDPRLWSEAPIGSSYPACMAVKAAQEQGPEAAGRYLRALREGLMCFRRKLDTREALVAEARAAGLDGARFGSSLGSHAIVEAFGADLEETRSADAELPSLRFGDQVIARAPPTPSGGRPRWPPAPRPSSGRSPIRSPLSTASGAPRPSRSRLSATCRSRGLRPSCGAWPRSRGCGRCAC